MDAPEHDDVSNYGMVDGEPLPSIKPGLYDLRYDYYETKAMFGKAPKLVLWFTVVTMGEHFDRVKLPRYYNLTKLIGKPRKFGRFKVGHMSAFLREYARLFSTPNRLDRISMSAFERVLIEGKVRQVNRGADQREIPEGLQYSVIDELVRVKR